MNERQSRSILKQSIDRVNEPTWVGIMQLQSHHETMFASFSSCNMMSSTSHLDIDGIKSVQE